VKWLITGGCGFIGVNLVRRLAAQGKHAIRIVDNLSGGTRDDLAAVSVFTEVSPAQIPAPPLSPLPGSALPELVVGDVLDDQLMVKVSRGMEVIVHLAANSGVASSVANPRWDCLTNVMGTFNGLEAAWKNGIRRFVFASSGAPVGECQPPIHEEVVPRPVSPYGASKLCGEAYCSAYYRTFGVETVALRFANVYGPFSRHKNSVVAKFIRQAITGERLEVYGDGCQTRDFIYVDDLAEAVILAAVGDAIGGEVFQIGTGFETTVTELMGLLLPLLNKAGLRNAGARYGPPRLGDVRRNFTDPSKAQKQLGWRAEVALADGLTRTVQWFVNNSARLRTT